MEYSRTVWAGKNKRQRSLRTRPVKMECTIKYAWNKNKGHWLITDNWTLVLREKKMKERNLSRKV